VNDDQAERLIDVLVRLHVDLETTVRWVRDNADKWLVWLASKPH